MLTRELLRQGLRHSPEAVTLPASRACVRACVCVRAPAVPKSNQAVASCPPHQRRSKKGVIVRQLGDRGLA